MKPSSKSPAFDPIKVITEKDATSSKTMFMIHQSFILLLRKIRFLFLYLRTIVLLAAVSASYFSFSQIYVLKGRLYNSETKELLPFGTIYNLNGYAVSNEDGVFELKVAHPIRWIKVQYTGYKHDSIAVAPGIGELDIFLQPQLNVLNDVVIKAKSGNFRYQLLLKAIDSYFKNGIKEVNCKSYYRTYTLLNRNQPAELFEAFYNQTSNAMEVKDLKLKGGRFLLPRNKTFINFASTVLIEMFKPFKDGQTTFPFSPMQCATLLQLKNNFKVTIKNILRTESDTLYHIAFFPLDTVNGFSGELFYYKRTNRVEKVKLLARNVTQHPLYSMRDSLQDQISGLNYAVEIGYRLHGQKNLISYVNFDLDFRLKTGKKTDHVTTNTKMLNFDFGKSFSLPLYPEIEFKFDYEKVAVFPYNESLFRNNSFIKEAEKDLFVRKLFDSIRCYNSVTLDESLLFLPKRYQRWHPEWQADEDLVSSSFFPEVHTNYGNNFAKSKRSAWDSMFAYTFLFLDYDCYQDTPVFVANALMDYNYSFLMNRKDPLSFEYFSLFLDNSKIQANQMLSNLRKKYKDRCPTEKELREDYDKFSIGNINSSYHIHTLANSPEKAQEYPTLSSSIKAALEK